MIERTSVERILHAAVRAPSGDNSQPWSFSVEGDSIVVRSHPEKDHPILNVEARGTHIATGALLENISIAAAHEGLWAEIALFPAEDIAARVRLHPSEKKGHHLFDSIDRRHSHRGAYKKELTGEMRNALAQEDESCEVRVIDTPEAIKRLASAISMMEEAALHTKKIHYEFFRNMLWSAKENATGQPGLYIKTTELPPPVQALFRLIRHWPFMRFLNVLGFPRVAASKNAVIYASSGALIAIAVSNTRREDFIAAGRCMQRIWLEATRRGLACQPLAGLIYLAEYVAKTNDPDIPERLKVRIQSAKKEVDTIVNMNGKLAMLLRVGEPLKAASARSVRHEPLII